jgi:Fe-S cluster assembly scaffold protein SufB
VKDNARADLGGMIKVEKKGGGAESFLSEHAILLDPGARATADPKLEIGNNDVMSRHSASVSQINDAKVFYLMTRGISRDDARGLIVSGFLESAISRIEDEGFRKEFIETMAKSL